MKWAYPWVKARQFLHERERKADLEILWPALCDVSDNIDVAREAFKLHAMTNDSWSDLSDAEIQDVVDKLQAPPK